MGLRLQPKSKERVTKKRDVILPQGLIGFQDLKRFRIEERARSEEGAFFWLEARDSPHLRFLAIAPSRLPGLSYEPELPAHDLEWLRCTRGAEDAEVMVLVARRGKKIVANLRAPLVLNGRTGIGKQVILEQDHYSTEAPLGLAAGRSALGFE